MSRYDQAKRNYASHHKSPRRRRSQTFMEFVHRQEEHQGNHEKTGQSNVLDNHPAQLIDMADLLLAGTLMFIFITMLLLVMN